jgi:hypothetical protein
MTIKRIRPAVCLLLCIFLVLGALYLYSVLPPKYESNTSVISNQVISQADIIAHQPYLYIDPTDLERNGKPIEIGYCTSDAELLLYYTLIYIWEFSDTPWFFQMLGYPDHGWDYEPLIVVIDKQTNEANYVYDKGHYRAGITQSRFLEVKINTHYFAPSENQDGKIFDASHFHKLTPEQLDLMNRQIAALPRLPFSKALSLQWACNTPENVIQERSFSGGTQRGFVPVQINMLGGMLAGLAASTIIKCIALLIGCVIGITWRRVIWIGLMGGLAGGITGGTLTYIAQLISSSNNSHIIATLIAIVMGAALGAIICKIMYKGPILRSNIAVLGTICGIAGSLLTSMW